MVVIPRWLFSPMLPVWVGAAVENELRVVVIPVQLQWQGREGARTTERSTLKNLVIYWERLCCLVLGEMLKQEILCRGGIVLYVAPIRISDFAIELYMG